jgi:hypothetical protein
METRKPNDLRFLNLVPILVLSVSLQEVLDPVDQVFRRPGRYCALPLGWHETLEHAGSQGIKILGHTDLSDKGTLQVLQAPSHRYKKNVEALEFLEEHDLGRLGSFEFLLDVENVEHFRELVLNFTSNFGDVFFTVDATGSTTIGSLHHECIRPKFLDSVGEVLNLGIGVETEDSGIGEERDLFDLNLNEFLRVSLLWDNIVEVSLGEEELLVAVEDEVAHEFLEVGVEHTSVVVISDTATVHGLTNEVTESGPGELLFVSLNGLVQVQGNQVQGDTEVGVVEIVRDVPADLAELLAFLDGCVEERKHVDERFVLLLGALMEDLFGDFGVRHLDVSLKTIWGFSDDLK